jgi:broad specificity phosphatase PhoE
MILMRHGQSYFNVVYGATRTDPGIRDPGLTDEGRRQVRDAAASLNGAPVAELLHQARRRTPLRILASPYRRTLETAEIIAESFDLPVAIEPLIRERAAFTCDIGSSPAHLAHRWPQFRFDGLSDRWWQGDRRDGAEESEASLLERCGIFRRSMAARPDWHAILVVTHWGFVRGLTGHELKNAQMLAYDPGEGRSMLRDSER